MILFITILFVVIYCYALYLGNKDHPLRLSIKNSILLKRIHYSGLLLILLFSIPYFKYDITVSGAWTQRSLILIVLITGIFLKLFINKSILSKLEKLYFTFLSFLPAFTSVFLFIPFLGIAIVTGLLGLLLSPHDKVYFEDRNLRIQSTFGSALTGEHLEIYQKYNFYEQKIYVGSNTYIKKIPTKLKVNYDTDSTRIEINTDDSIKEVIVLQKIRS